jgi:hypothetical protein
MKTLSDIIGGSPEFLRLNPHLFSPSPAAGKSTERERDLHDQILDACTQRRWYVVHSRMDRPTTTALGVPDFVIAMDGGRVLWVECKTRTGKLTSEQEAVKARLERLGHAYVVVRSLREFMEAV